MNFRETEIYIGGRTQRRLRWIAKAEGELITPDALADKVLNEWVEKTYPQILPIEKRLEVRIEETKRDMAKSYETVEREVAASITPAT